MISHTYPAARNALTGYVHALVGRLSEEELKQIDEASTCYYAGCSRCYQRAGGGRVLADDWPELEFWDAFPVSVYNRCAAELCGALEALIEAHKVAVVETLRSAG